MSALTVVMPYSSSTFFTKMLSELIKSGLFDSIQIVCDRPVEFHLPRCYCFVADSLLSGQTLNEILAGIKTGYLLLLHDARHVSFEPEAIDRLIGTAGSSGAGLVYSDFYDETGETRAVHPLNDYQLGSVRDDFDFGAIMLFSVPAVRAAMEKYGAIPPVRFAGLYDLWLKVSIDNLVYHISEPLYSVIEKIDDSAVERHFAYVDPKNAEAQREMELVFTNYLKKIGAYIPPEHLRKVADREGYSPVEATVVIPIRNRAGTIADAVKSALAQETDFPFNVIVVDNHSTDGTTAALSAMAGNCPQLLHAIPERTDLGIGGCWNEALYRKACGRYAVQLDSDDLYIGPHALQKIVDMLRQDSCAMVIGSYTIVNFNLEEIPPGLIDHREWTDENGHNNALRINGLGAPRAFNVNIMRNIGFLNVSYGEDYAAALRICREHRVNRIYESLYLCRRWQGNTDAELAIVDANRNDAFKDKVRTEEILARQEMMKGVDGRS